MSWLSVGWGRAGWWGDGVGGSADPSPVQLYICARHKGRAWGSPAISGPTERKGTETGRDWRESQNPAV